MRTKEKPLLPFLKWPGGKRKLAPKIAELYELHSDRRLVEPFCGGLSIALHLRPSRAWLNDINPHLINLYRTIQAGGFQFVGENTEEYYYEIRDKLNDGGEDGYLAAQCFYYLNTAGFNGLCRYNSDGGFNVPYGKRKRLAVCEDFQPYAEAMRQWDFSCDGYRGVAINDDDFLVLDPPYDAGFTKYSGNSFGWEQQLDLVDWIADLKCPIIAHNLATNRIIELYTSAGFDIELIEVGRSISCDGDRKKAVEVFATKNQ
jgi:DNA adenine methylase